MLPVEAKDASLERIPHEALEQVTLGITQHIGHGIHFRLGLALATHFVRAAVHLAAELVVGQFVGIS